MLGRIFLWTGIGCAGLLGLIVLLAIISIVVFPDSEDSGEVATNVQESESEVEGAGKKKEQPSEARVFEDSQGRKDLYTVYVPPDMAASDHELYAIAMREYPERGEQVQASFFTDVGDAEAAACYEQQKNKTVFLPCDGRTSVEYPTHEGYVILTPESRIIYRSFPYLDMLEAELESWEVAKPPLPLKELDSPKWSETNIPVITVDFDIAVRPGSDSSIHRLCTDAYSVYKLFSQRETQKVDVLTVHFLIGDTFEIGEYHTF